MIRILSGPWRRQILLAGGLLLAGAVPVESRPASDSRYFFFLSDQRVVTVELVNRTKAILNYINLGDTFEVLQGTGLLPFGKDGQAYPGRFIETEEADPLKKFVLSRLVPPHRFNGYTLRGAFPEPEGVEKVYLKVGSRIAELEAVPERDFEALAARIESMNLTLSSGMQIVTEAGFRRGYGLLHPAGSPEAARLEEAFPETRLLPPLVLSNPGPRLPQAYAHLPDPVVVEISGRVNRAGGIRDLQVTRSLQSDLDDLALQAVRNGWSFLPAVSEGEAAESDLTLAVVFRRP